VLHKCIKADITLGLLKFFIKREREREGGRERGKERERERCVQRVQ